MKKLFVLIVLLGASLMATEKTVFDFTLNSIDGQPAPLSTYKGKLVLLVNVASRCVRRVREVHRPPPRG